MAASHLQYGSDPLAALNEQFIQKAPQACLTCRKQKRRCNKALPSCALCERMNRACDYSDSTPASNAEDYHALRQRLAELESHLKSSNGGGVLPDGPYLPPSSSNSMSRGENPPNAPIYIQQDPAYLNVQNRFPSIAFLDAKRCDFSGAGVPIPPVQIPGDVVDALGDGSAIQAVTDEYFSSVHMWIPIVSKKRIDRVFQNPVFEPSPDLLLLFVAMKLMITKPQDHEIYHNFIYTTAKRFLALHEACGTTSILVLQAYILIATFEIGQAIYPSAWMSVGACARYGELLGINNHEAAPPLLSRADSGTEVEERKRSCVVAAGSKGRSLAVEDPQKDSPLPIDTTSWEADHMITAAPLEPLSTTAEHIDSFARLCQAAYLLGKIERHHLYLKLPESQESLDDTASLYLETTNLTKEILAEASPSPQYLSFAASLGVCFSALYVLCEPYASRDRPNSANSDDANSMQTQAIEGLKEVAASIQKFAENINARTPLASDLDRVSPFIIDSFYSAAANYAWLVTESGNAAYQTGYETIRHCLTKLKGRWHCAAATDRLLEAQEFTYAMGGAAGAGTGSSVS